MLSKIQARLICIIVASDPEARKRIDSNIPNIMPSRWGVSGSLRNWGYVAIGADASEAEYADRVCTGISDACSAAINGAVKAKDARVRSVKHAVPVSRVRFGVDHTAVRITMTDDQNHMFDWHATLEAKNPMLHRTEALWVKGDGGVTLDDFEGFR